MKYKKGQVVYILGRFKGIIAEDHNYDTGIPVKLVAESLSPYERAQVYHYSSHLVQLKKYSSPLERLKKSIKSL